ncbi:MAG: hypothetical protein LIP01_08955 [Tannerellaceae bacterium]|nr:hypothetical protein [Tannerellaceae bacterium]
MRKNIHISLMLAMVLCLLASCNKQTYSTASHYTYESECLGVELDGSQTLRAWGTGRNKADTVEQAKKNAVRDVLFKGIRSGNNECNTRSLVTEVNAQEKYEAYFNRFLTDRGDYRKYVSIEDEKRKSKVKKSNQSQMQYSIVVRVKRSELRERLQRDNVIN